MMPLLVMSKAAVFVFQQCMLTQGWVRIVFPSLPSVRLENSQLQQKKKTSGESEQEPTTAGENQRRDWKEREKESKT